MASIMRSSRWNRGSLGGGMKTPVRPGTPGSALRGSMLSGPMSGRKRSRDCRTLFQDDDTSDPIQVMVRVRPPRDTNPDHPDEEVGLCVDTLEDDKLLITTPPQRGSHGPSGSNEGLVKQYAFTKVFPEDTTQAEYYASCGAPLVEEMMSKYSNYCMLAYGITGAGKTYTLEGLPANPGVLPRALEHLFELLQLHENADNLAVAVSYYEIYNEHIYDLLLLNPRGSTAPSTKPGELKVMEDASGSVCIPGLTVRTVQSAKEAMELQLKGSALRTKAGTRLNSSSSRSHAIFTVMLCESTDVENLPDNTRNRRLSLASASKAPVVTQSMESEGLFALSKLSFVDMAGAERANRTGNSGQRFKESVKINGSLLALGRCLEALRHNQMNPNAQSQLIPYRNSKITHIFRDVLHGQGRLMLAVSVSPDECDHTETVHMIEYARASMDIRTVALPNERPVAPVSSMYATPGTGKKRRTTLLGADFTASRAFRDTGVKASEDLEALKEELLAAKSELEEVKFNSASEKVELRRELNQKMQLTLDNSEEMWQEKTAALQKELEQVNAAYRELLAGQGNSAVDSAAMAAKIREDVKRELAQQHQRELDTLKDQSAAALAQQAHQLSMQASSNQQVQQLTHRIAEERTGREAAESQVTELKAQMAQAETQRLLELEKMMDELQALTAEKEEADANQELEIRLIQERHQVDMKNAEAHANKLEAQLQELEECLQATHEEAIKELEGKHHAEIEEVATALATLETEMADAREADLNALKTSHAAELQKMSEQIKAASQTHTDAALNSKLEALQAEHLHALEAQEELHKKALADLRTTLEEQHQQDAEEFRASTNKEVEALEEELEDKNRQQRQLMERLQSFQREHEATLEAHQKELASLEAMESPSTENPDIEELMSQHAQAMDALRAQYDEQMKAQRKSYNQVLQALEEVQQDAEATKCSLQTKIDELLKKPSEVVSNVEAQTLRQQKKELMIKMEAMTREKAMLVEQHAWELKLVKENANLDMQTMDTLSEEMESFVRQKGELVTKLINARKEKSKLEQEHQMHAQQLKLQVENDEKLREEMRKKLEKELDEEYSEKIEFLKMEMGSDSEMLIHEISNIHKQKNQLREKLDDANRERNHLTELISLLATQHPHLFQEESDLHQSMDSAAWQHIKHVRNSMRLPH